MTAAGAALPWTPWAPLGLAAALSPAEVDACGPSGQAHDACVITFRLTHNQTVAKLADVILAKPLKILLIVVVALLVQMLARRTIARFVAGLRSPGLHRLAGLRRHRLAEAPPPTLRAAQRAETIGSLLNSVAGFAIWAIALATILSVFGINLGPLIAGAGIAGVAIGFGAQTLVKDFLTGMFMLVEDQYGVGDRIDTGFAIGVVEGISLRATRVRDEAGTVWYVPHSSITRIGNQSQGGPANGPEDAGTGPAGPSGSPSTPEAGPDVGVPDAGVPDAGVPEARAPVGQETAEAPGGTPAAPVSPRARPSRRSGGTDGSPPSTRGNPRRRS